MLRLRIWKAAVVAVALCAAGLGLGLGSISVAGSAADQAGAGARGQFPEVVRFKQGATQFLDGDQITITEVHGTAAMMAEGNIYLIRGKYGLASHDRATIAAYITANNAADGTSKSLRVQQAVVEQGNGTFHSICRCMATAGRT